MRPSSCIRARQVSEIRRASRHAWRLNRPLSRLIVTDFGAPIVGDEGLQARQHRAIRTKARSWWDYRRSKGIVSGPFTDVLTWENPNNRVHSNWLVHVPDNVLAEFLGMLEVWHRKVLGELPDDAVHEQAIWNVNGILSYVLKGAEPEYAKATGIVPEPQGIIWGRRAFAAMCLGKAARKRDVEASIVVQAPIKGLPLPRETRVLRGVSWKRAQRPANDDKDA